MRMLFLLVALLSVGFVVSCSGSGGGGSGTSPAMSLAQKIYEATGMTYSDVLSQVAQQYADEWKNDPSAYSSHDSATIIADVTAIDPTYGGTLASATEVNYVDTAENAGNADLAWENYFESNLPGGYDDYGCGFAYTDWDFGGGMKRYYFWVVILADKS